MTLKGYNWYNDKGDVVAYYLFKDLTIRVHENIATTEDINKFKLFLNENGEQISEIKYL